ncbi:coiled-coil domain-containing protein 112-like [Macrosteles quadrilineatus]|uniref:coiled-coil domain-containing protein 112-like n=1 Tax=Macrosteles quadrilineatus TaxID=74068 RepID=UPI0023E0CDAA|nr:coiled-coil domain-containing protein 112-like [Macrosteles quadrilineatus]
MGKHEDCKYMERLKEDLNETCDNTANVDFTDGGKCLFDYTNRRKIKMSAESHKNSEEQKKENEKEFEYIRLQLEEFSVSDSSSAKSTVKTNSGLTLTSSTTVRPEVEAFQRFLHIEGGHYGGWKEKDHMFFLNTRKKYSLKKTAEIVHENLPDISLEKVIAHETWYNEYLKLKAAKKTAIEEWKKTQKAVKVVVKENSQPCPQTEPKPQPKRDPNLKEKIEIWKAHCVAAKLERMEQQRKEEMKKKREDEERKRHQEEKRALVNRYREDKLSFELALKTAKETEELEAKREAAVKAATLLKYFRYEDRRFTERQIAKKQPQVKPEPRVKSAVEVKRDPNRLLQPTLGWIYHTRRRSETDTDTNLTTPMDLKHMPRLKKPAWRRGLTSP